MRALWRREASSWRSAGPKLADVMSGSRQAPPWMNLYVYIYSYMFILFLGSPPKCGFSFEEDQQKDKM
jgi:hypothetical protein